MGSEVQPGTRIGAYRVERLIGRGGMGAVYYAVDEALDRPVALKLLGPPLARDDRFVRRFLLESKLAARLDHPAIVPVFAAGQEDGQLFIAMRYVAGGTLEDRIEQRVRLDPLEVCTVLDAIASALDAAHADGLVHRDVKPGNILLDDTRAYLCDFGLARGATTVDSLSGVHGMSGTLAYVAPEQIEGDIVDGRADQYALACVVYEALTGRRPFARETDVATVYAHLSDAAPSAVAARPDLPVQIDAVIARGLAKRPDDRFGTCADLMAEARGALTGEQAPVHPPVTEAATTRQPRTFLIANLRGYTPYTQAHGSEAAASLVRRFGRVVANVAHAHDGMLVDTRGDEALLVFDTAAAALRAAVALHRSAAEADLADGLGIGLDAGEAVASEASFRGDAINRAARLCAIADAGQTLTTAAVAHMSGHLDEVEFHDRGTRRLKGLAEPVAVQLATERGTPGPRRARRRGRLLAVAVTAAAVTGGIAFATSLDGGSRNSAASGVDAPRLAPPSSITWYDAKTLRQERTLRLSTPAATAVSAGGYLWAPDNASHKIVTRIDPTTGSTKQYTLPGETGGFGAAGDALWWGSASEPLVARIDAVTGAVTDRIKLPTDGYDFDAFGQRGVVWVSIGSDAVFVAYGTPSVIARIGLQSKKVERVFQIKDRIHCCQLAMAVDGDALWAVDRFEGGFARLDALSGDVLASGKLHGGWVDDVGVSGGFLWVPVENDRGAWQIDRGGRIRGLVPTGSRPLAVFGDEFAWVTNKNDETVTRIDPLTGAKHTFRVGSSPNAVVVDPNGKLVVVTGDHVADPMVGLAGRKIATFLLQFDVFHPDPVMSASDMGGPGASVHKAIGLNLTRMAYDPQPHLVLDAASRFATSLDGRTFTFTIRPGLRFSPPSGKPVTAETFRLSLERTLSAAFQSNEEQATFGYLRDVVGARAFHTGKSDHVAGISARGDQLTIRLERAGSDLPIALTLPMFQAVPDGTGAPAGGARDRLPSAGPFYVSAYEPGRHLVLRANPNYHGNRKRSLDAVVFRIAWSPSLAVDQVVKGKADGVAVDPDGVMDVRSTIAHRYAPATQGQPHWSIGAYPGIAFLQFNTTRGPFRDVALRRAVNRAIDRKAFADQTDQIPLDSLVAPGTPGYEPRLIAQPDRAALDRLLRGKTLAVTMYYDADPEQRSIARVVSAQLEHIGIHVTAKAVGSPNVTARAVADRPDEAFDLRLDHWWLEVIDVGNTVNNLVDPRHERYPLPQLFRNAEWNRLVRDARRRTGNEREQTYKRLAARLVDEQAPVAVLSAWTEPELTSARLGCVVPTHWLDLEQLCLN